MEDHVQDTYAKSIKITDLGMYWVEQKVCASLVRCICTTKILRQCMLPVILLVFALVLLFYIGTRKPRGYPPGPKWWPILGSAIEVARLREKTGYLMKTCSALSEKYGPVVGLKIGANRIVVLNNHESIRTMMTEDDCDGRPTGIFYEMRTFGERRGLAIVDGNLWAEQRRFVLKHLREFGYGRKDMSTVVEEEGQCLVEHFKKLIDNEYNNRFNLKSSESRIHCNNNEPEDGKISKLSKGNRTDESVSMNTTGQYAKNEKPLKASDLYVNANEYAEVRRIAGSNPGMVMTMNDAFGVTVLNALWRMMAGKRFNNDDEELTYLQRILAKVMMEVDTFGAPFGHFPFLRFIAPEMSGYKSFLEAHVQIWKFLKNELDNHKNTFKTDSPRDLMDVYLSVLKSENYSSTFSESQLLAICLDLFVAGSETTTKALAFCFLYLVLYPDVQKKAHDEIDRVIGRNRPPTIEDRAKLTYINAIILESMRMFIGHTLNLPHRAVKDITILGHRIPKDTVLVGNYNTILMDESWGDPEVFRPERFIDEEGNITTPKKYFPFGLGRRRCMGENMARSNIFIIMTALLQAFTFSPVPGERKPSEEFADGFTASPKPFRALVSLRT
ncbi:PREDICTED: probable cytochrome P450 303a1 [Dufourea novaeangliae]|uniref:probable cytochrome P450 303a1 n=1 Tax=Dufourea novaeangliae TaxID=178035 RepID=UPI0007677FCD|nr:PREDICTED: probable cytochrome P450 303a1 [Dufourea novaeangliae]